MKKNIFTLFLTLFFIGCGYKPTIDYAKPTIKGSVYTILHVDINNGENSVYLKDYINRLLLTQFNAKLAQNKQTADMIIDLTFNSLSQRALQTDDKGYVRIYRITVDVKIIYWNNVKNVNKKVMKLSNYEDYIVDDDSTITAVNKDIAIRNSIQKILDSFTSTIAIHNINESR